MIKGYYIWAPMESGCIGEGSGIEKKIKSQINVLKKVFDVTWVVIEPDPPSKKNKIISRLPFAPVANRWLYLGDMNDAAFIYIRQVRHDFSFILYLRRIKEKNPLVKIIYEIPTYPYENESKTTIRNFHIRFKDRFHRTFLKKYVDRIVTFYNQDSILGIPTIKVINGFDFSSVKINHVKRNNKTLDIIEVSTTAFWHGFDRFLEGLKNYGSTPKIVET